MENSQKLLSFPSDQFPQLPQIQFSRLSSLLIGLIFALLWQGLKIFLSIYIQSFNFCTKGDQREQISNALFRLFASIWLISTGIYSLREISLADLWRKTLPFCFVESRFGTKLFLLSALGFFCSMLFDSIANLKEINAFQLSLILHHILAIWLISQAWLGNLWAMASIVLLFHECADILLAFLKLAKEFPNFPSNLLNAGFVAFLIVWVCTRLILFPLLICRQANQLSKLTTQIRIMLNLLGSLFLLHIYWTGRILMVAMNMLRGKIENEE